MKTKLAAFLASLTVITSPCTRAADIFSEADIALKLEQIELDVALKQFEKVASALAEFSLEASLAESEDLPAEKLRELENRRDRRLVILQKSKEELRAQIRERGAHLEKLREQATHTRSANRSDMIVPRAENFRAKPSVPPKSNPLVLPDPSGSSPAPTAPGTPTKGDPFFTPSVPSAPSAPSAPVTSPAANPGGGVTPTPR